MSVFKAVGRGFILTHRLWFGILAALLFYSAFEALESVLLPYEVKPGQVQRIPVEQGSRKGYAVFQTAETFTIPEITNPDEMRAVAAPAITLLLFSSAVALYFLGGILGRAGRLIEDRKARCSPADFLRASHQQFLPMLKWGFSLFILAVGLMILSGLILAIFFRDKVAAAAQLGKEAAVLPILLFQSISMAMTALLIFSPVILVEKGQGVWRSFGESTRFLGRHLLKFMGLFACIVLVAVVVDVFGIFLAKVVGGMRESLHVAPFAKGWPVFFFKLILGIPQSYLTVFLPATLTAYYHAATR